MGFIDGLMVYIGIVDVNDIVSMSIVNDIPDEEAIWQEEQYCSNAQLFLRTPINCDADSVANLADEGTRGDKKNMKWPKRYPFDSCLRLEWRQNVGHYSTGNSLLYR